MGQQKEYSLLMAALVAIVAIVGLVVYFTGGATGAYNFEVYDNPSAIPYGYQLPVGVDPAFYMQGYDTFGPACTQMTTMSDSRSCCNSKCWSWCEGRDPVVSGRTIGDCVEHCESGCYLRRAELVRTS